MLDLEVDTGEFPVSELKALLKSLHQKKRYHRLRDGRLLRLDDSLEVLDELNETLELSGAKLGQSHARLPLYRAPSLDWALSGQTGVRFDRDDAFRRISRSFHAVKDSEYAPPASLQKTLRKYQRDGYRWLRTLDSYGTVSYTHLSWKRLLIPHKPTGRHRPEGKGAIRFEMASRPIS